MAARLDRLLGKYRGCVGEVVVASLEIRRMGGVACFGRKGKRARGGGGVIEFGVVGGAERGLAWLGVVYV